MYRKLIESSLLKNNYLTESGLRDIKYKSSQQNRNFEDYLVEENHISNQDLLKLIADDLGLDYTNDPINLMDKKISSLVSESYARKHHILPLYIKKDTLYIATHQAFKLDILEDLAMMTSLDCKAVVSPLEAIQSCITQMYTHDHAISKANVSQEDSELRSRVDSAPTVQLVNSIIYAAYNQHASDIHFEAEETYTKVRFRVDGDLLDYLQIEAGSHDAITTRIKIMAKMNIAEKRIPQDGALSIRLHKQRIDLRVASIPTRFGEKLVLRILGSEKALDYNIDALQMNESMRTYLKSLTKMPNGIILVTGPTGSGKTTTLYSMLNEIASPTQSVITIEDPVEKEFEGITQVGINTKAGLSFAKGLRSILRLDPDVIMIGEIRDKETASISIRAAITGHLVLSTLHTNDALSSIIRLIDMGAESYMVASSVKSVIAQRLVRKNCEYCKKEQKLENQDRILLQDPSLHTYLKGEGCDHCQQSGYKGRLAVFEAIPIDPKLQSMIADGKTYHEMHDYITSRNIPLLKDDLLRLLHTGQTSMDEVKKILFSNELFNLE